MNPGWLLPVLLFMALPFPARAGDPPATGGVQAEVLRMEQARIAAVLAADVPALDGMMTADCRYVHSTGRVETKPEFLAAFANGTRHYAIFRWLQPPTVRIYGARTAILTAPAHLEVVPKGAPPISLDAVYTAVYVLVGEQWQLASYHSTGRPK